MGKEDPTQKQIALLIADSASVTEREALKIWVQELLAIVSADLSPTTRARKAIRATASNKVLWPVVKLISREMKRHAWDNRNAKWRSAYGGIALALATVGGQSAGIAALGGAIAVPLWVVFGAGAAFLPVLYEALVGKDQQTPLPKTTYKVIDAEKDEI